MTQGNSSKLKRKVMQTQAAPKPWRNVPPLTVRKQDPPTAPISATTRRTWPAGSRPPLPPTTTSAITTALKAKPKSLATQAGESLMKAIPAQPQALSRLLRSVANLVDQVPQSNSIRRTTMDGRVLRAHSREPRSSANRSDASAKMRAGDMIDLISLAEVQPHFITCLLPRGKDSGLIIGAKFVTSRDTYGPGAL